MPDGSPRDPPTRLWVGRTDVGNPRGFPHPCDPSTAVWVGRGSCHQASCPSRIVQTGLFIHGALVRTMDEQSKLLCGWAAAAAPDTAS